MIYSVAIYDENGDRIAVLDNASAPRYSRSKNTGDQVSFKIPRNDPKLVFEAGVGAVDAPLTVDMSTITVDSSLLTVDATVYDDVSGSSPAVALRTGRRFEILRAVGQDSTYLECSGFISSHGYSGEWYEVEGFTEEILLTQVLTPAQFGYPLYSENQTIDTFVSQFDRAYVTEQAKWAWGDYIAFKSSTIDTEINPTFLILKTVSVDEETGKPTYAASGDVTFRFQKQANETWERIRWVSDYFEKEGKQVTTLVAYRVGTTIGALGPFTTPVAGSLTDVVGLKISDTTSPILEVKVYFATTEPAISPVLYALEVVKRRPWDITTVEVIGTASALATPGIDADNATFFDVLTAALEPHGWEFGVLDGTLTVRETFGVNRTNEYSVVAG